MQVYGSSTRGVVRFIGEGYAGLRDSPSCDLIPQIHHDEQEMHAWSWLSLIGPDLV